MANKYQPLADYLLNVSGDEIQMSFKDVEQVLGSALPAVAYSSPAFWANSKTDDSHTWSHLWQAAGWGTSEVDVPGQKLVFRRASDNFNSTSLSSKQVRILQYLAGVSGWSTRKQMEDAAGPKGFSKALGAPTAGPILPGTLEGLGLVERADGESPRVFRRLIHLRGLSHEQVEQVLT